jgi:hypothetical protein
MNVLLTAAAVLPPVLAAVRRRRVGTTLQLAALSLLALAIAGIASAYCANPFEMSAASGTSLVLAIGIPVLSVLAVLPERRERQPRRPRVARAGCWAACSSPSAR